MSARVLSSVWLLCLVIAMPVGSQEPVRAAFSAENAKVRFWQTDHLAGGQGTCVVRLGFDGTALKAPIEDLTLTIRVLDKNGVGLGTADLALLQPIGPPMASRYGEALFEGVPEWPLQDDGEPSPLCDEGTTLVVESAVGKQSGRVVDLVRFGQLEFTAFPRLNIKVKN